MVCYVSSVALMLILLLHSQQTTIICFLLLLVGDGKEGHCYFRDIIRQKFDQQRM